MCVEGESVGICKSGQQEYKSPVYMYTCVGITTCAVVQLVYDHIGMKM